MIHITAFLVTFIYVFLRVFQQRNVSHEEYWWMVGTSYLITAFEILNISLIVSKGWILFPALGTGGAIGSILAVQLHKRLKNVKRS